MARDKIHEDVKTALVKDGWKILRDPFSLRIGKVQVDIDLAAERAVIAEKDRRKCIFEIKSFRSPSLLYDFHLAMGQYVNYRGALEDAQIDSKLYLAISYVALKRLNKSIFYRRRLEQNSVRLLIVNTHRKKIVKWIR